MTSHGRYNPRNIFEQDLILKFLSKRLNKAFKDLIPSTKVNLQISTLSFILITSSFDKHNYLRSTC